MRSPTKADESLLQFLLEPVVSGPRTRCPTCNASRQFYCCTCLQLLLPDDEQETIPRCIKEGSLSLPFDLDIVLDDRRVVSTGVQTAILLQSAATNGTNSVCRLLDVKQEVHLPDYQIDQEHETYLLFPDPTSVPLSSVVTSHHRSRPSLRLVVLDCRWARQGLAQADPSLSKLIKVHLDDPPNQSHYWRWHNSGEGMLSTVEAVYYAAWQVGQAVGWTEEQLLQLVHLFWLFRHQRQTIQKQYEHGEGQKHHPAPLPFTEEGKEFYRSKHLSQSARHGL